MITNYKQFKDLSAKRQWLAEGKANGWLNENILSDITDKVKNLFAGKKTETIYYSADIATEYFNFFKKALETGLSNKYVYTLYNYLQKMVYKSKTFDTYGKFLFSRYIYNFLEFLYNTSDKNGFNSYNSGEEQYSTYENRLQQYKIFTKPEVLNYIERTLNTLEYFILRADEIGILNNARLSLNYNNYIIIDIKEGEDYYIDSITIPNCVVFKNKGKLVFGPNVSFLDIEKELGPDYKSYMESENDIKILPKLIIENDGELDFTENKELEKKVAINKYQNE